MSIIDLANWLESLGRLGWVVIQAFCVDVQQVRMKARGCFLATIPAQPRKPCRLRHPYAVPRTSLQCVCTQRRNCIEQLSPFLKICARNRLNAIPLRCHNQTDLTNRGLTRGANRLRGLDEHSFDPRYRVALRCGASLFDPRLAEISR